MRLEKLEEDASLWKFGRDCPFGCLGRWHSPETYDAHAVYLQHQRIVREKLDHVRKKAAAVISQSENAPTAKPPEKHGRSEVRASDTKASEAYEGHLKPDQNSQNVVPGSLSTSSFEGEIRRLSDQMRSTMIKAEVEVENFSKNLGNNLYHFTV